LVLFGAIAEAADDRQPAPAGQIEYGDILGEAHRVVQGQQESHDHHLNAWAPAEDETRTDEWRRTPSVIGAVMLLQGHQSESVRVGVGRHVE
jgi:hypothetical protein